MAKEKPFMIVEVPVTIHDLDYTLDCLVDFGINDEYSGDAIDMSGIDIKELREGIASLPAFQKMVQDAVTTDGRAACEDSPYDYMNFSTVYCTPEWQALTKHLDFMEEILKGTTANQKEYENLERAIAVVKSNGYSVLKAV